jgi:hypothetical protein
MRSPTDAELAWAAGLFEGEGTFNVTKRSTNISMALVSTDEDVVDRFHAIVGAGRVYRNRTSNGFSLKKQYVWNVSAINEFRHVAAILLPWLGNRRRARMLQVLDAYSTAPVKRNASRPYGRFA